MAFSAPHRRTASQADARLQRAQPHAVSQAVRPSPHRTRHARCGAFKEPREELSAEQVEEWDRCAARLVGLGVQEEEAEKILKESYGWVSQKYWKRRVVCLACHSYNRMQSPASESQLEETFEFLKAETGLAEQDLGDVAVKFPQIFGCGEEQLQYAVETLGKSWRIKGKMLTNSVKRNPTLLGCVIDCYGDCAGDCERCWQRF